ncbi:hypothetical protein CVT26_013425 [Gymnopilus dilepis]|uniref:Uncharacterized protein n=1 Tax=Gymnopilus dilepis TaxID=231916 RepID=A0A409VV14_9AGAR|nr:hypothetical protein CVT26_013425 [Gymnopilus dilepis]
MPVALSSMFRASSKFLIRPVERLTDGIAFRAQGPGLKKERYAVDHYGTRMTKLALAQSTLDGVRTQLLQSGHIISNVHHLNSQGSTSLEYAPSSVIIDMSSS